MRDIEGKVAVVTGGANGIGLAMGRHFAEHGMKVMLADIQPGPLDEAVAGLRGDGLDAAGCVTDVTKPESVEQLAEQTVREFGGVHVLCNNAGIGPGGQTQLWEYEPNDWRWCLDVNVLGIAWGIKAFVPRMLAQGTEGHIVNTSSGNGGIAPMGDAAIYAMTKSAVTTLTELLYYQLKSEGHAALVLGAVSRAELAADPALGRVEDAPARVREDRRADHAVPELRGVRGARWKPREHRCRSPRSRRSPARVLDAIREDQFWINPGSDDPLDARYAAMKARRNPDYFRNWNAATGK